MPELKIGFNERNFHKVYPLYLKDMKIGDVTINTNKNIFIIFDITIYDDYRGNYYFPQFLNILEEKAREEAYDFILLQWVKKDKIQSLKNMGYKELSLQEKNKLTNSEKDELYVIKDLRV